MAGDVEKPRGRQDHLTADEIQTIRECFIARRPVGAVARELNCSERNIQKYYGFFRAEGVEQVPGRQANRISLPKLKFLEQGR